MELDVLAVGAHPDDVELCCGATLALLVSQGRRVGILHLTSGEKGTRGTVELRRQEAQRAAAVLGVEEVAFLDCGDGGLRHGEAEEDELVEHLRRWRPEIVLGPPPQDRHPDHDRAHRLVVDSCFYAGLMNRAPERGRAHRPRAFFAYMQHDPFAPSFIVDVTSTWEVKEAALAAYKTQLHQPGQGDGGMPRTRISSPDFADAVRGRGRHYGLLIGATFGEPFWSRNPIAVRDPWSLRPGGIA